MRCSQSSACPAKVPAAHRLELEANSNPSYPRQMSDTGLALVCVRAATDLHALGMTVSGLAQGLMLLPDSHLSRCISHGRVRHQCRDPRKTGSEASIVIQHTAYPTLYILSDGTSTGMAGTVIDRYLSWSGRTSHTRLTRRTPRRLYRSLE
jgi:hypothetical protein